MAWWDRFRLAGGRKNDTLALFNEIYGAAASSAGVAVTAKSAIQCGVAFACARVIAEGMSQIPFRLMRKADKTREAASEEPLYDLLENAPNSWMTSVEFFDTIGLHLVFAGNAFVWKNRVRGQIQELLPFEPRMVEVDFKNWVPTYKVRTDDGKTIDVPAEDMWHIRGPSMNGWFGLEGVKIAREAIGLAMTAEQHAAVTLANAAAPAGILTTDQNLSADQRTQLRSAWTNVHGGRINQGRVAVMSNGMKFVPISSDAESSQLIETRRFAVEEVCRPLRVWPIMVGYSDKTATYASAEQMFLAHVTHTMGPWYRRVEKSATVSLLDPAQRKSGLYFKFFAQALLRGASKERSEFYRTMVASGLMSPNECRELEDLNPYDGGDVFTRQINMGPIDASGNTPTPEPPAPAAPEPDPQADAASKAIEQRHAELLSQLANKEPPRVDVHIGGSTVNVQTPDVKVDAPITVQAGKAPDVKVDVAPPTVNVEAPSVHVAPSTATVDVKVDPAALIELKKQADKPWPVETEVTARDEKGRPSKYKTRPIE